MTKRMKDSGPGGRLPGVSTKGEIMQRRSARIGDLLKRNLRLDKPLTKVSENGLFKAGKPEDEVQVVKDELPVENTIKSEPAAPAPEPVLEVVENKPEPQPEPELTKEPVLEREEPPTAGIIEPPAEPAVVDSEPASAEPAPKLKPEPISPEPKAKTKPKAAAGSGKAAAKNKPKKKAAKKSKKLAG